MDWKDLDKMSEEDRAYWQKVYDDDWKLHIKECDEFIKQMNAIDKWGRIRTVIIICAGIVITTLLILFQCK